MRQRSDRIYYKKSYMSRLDDTETALKFSDFVNSDDCIGKIVSNSIRPETVYIPKNI